MPALRVDVNLSADSTVGTLSKADKSDIYSRDGTGSSTGGTAHDLYAPFYKALIPAALPGEGSILSDSGDVGRCRHASNNFTGFLGFTDRTTSIRRSRLLGSTTTGIRSPRATPMATTTATTLLASRSRCPRANGRGRLHGRAW